MVSRPKNLWRASSSKRDVMNCPLREMPMRFLFLSLMLMVSIAHAATTTQPAGLVVTKDAITIDPTVCTRGTGTLFFGLGSVQVKVVGQQEGQCVFDYTLDVEGGYTTWRCRVPVSDPPVVIQRNSDGAEFQKWVKTSIDLSKCEKIEAGNVHFGPSTRPATQPTAQAAARAKVLKEQIKSFRLNLQYHGEQDKPYYGLLLSVPALQVRRSNPVYPHVKISEAEASKIIEHLATEGFLNQAIDDASGMKLPAPPMPCYTMNVSCGGEAHRHEFYGVLGWGLPMLKRLDGLRIVLDGDAAKQLDVLLGRLSGHRREWGKEVDSLATFVAQIRAVLPKGWECSVISEPGRMGHPHGLEEPLFRMDFINRNESFQADGLPGEKRRLHPSMRLHFHRIQDKQRIMKVIEAERLYSWDIPIYFSETKDHLIVTSPPWINQGWYTDEARKLIAPLEQILKRAAATQPAASNGQWTKLYIDEPWYLDHKQPEQVFTGTLQRHVEPEVSILMRPHRYKVGERFLYPGKEHPDLEKLIGQKVEIRGKAYDVELEGQSVRETWPAMVRTAIDAAASPEAAWQAVLTAMQAGDKTALAKATTEKGCKSIMMSRQGQEITPQDMQSYGRAWAKWPLRFTRKTDDAAAANMGPEVREHGLEFVRTKEGWKLDQWMPGQ